MSISIVVKNALHNINVRFHRSNNAANEFMRHIAVYIRRRLQATIAAVHNFAIGQQVQQGLIGHFYLQLHVARRYLLVHPRSVGFAVKFEVGGEYSFHSLSFLE